MEKEKRNDTKQKESRDFEEFPKGKFGTPFGILNKREKILKKNLKMLH